MKSQFSLIGENKEGLLGSFLSERGGEPYNILQLEGFPVLKSFWQSLETRESGWS
jgi:hypothetical protein